MANRHRLKLYHGLASTCSKKVRFTLYEKVLPFESRLLDLQKFEQHTTEYLALNPNGVVPTLVDNGVPIIESSIIIEYLNDQFPDKPLMPAEARAKAYVRLWLKFSDEVAYKAVYMPTWHHLRKRAVEGLSPDRLSKTLSSIPTHERRERWAKMAESGYAEEELAEAYARMFECLEKLERGLEKAEYLAGDEFTLADIAVAPFVDRIKNLKPEYLIRPELPSLRRWYRAVSQRPAFQRAFDFKDDPRALELPNL
jgi:glutathione S-transferase